MNTHADTPILPSRARSTRVAALMLCALIILITGSCAPNDTTPNANTVTYTGRKPETRNHQYIILTDNPKRI